MTHPNPAYNDLLEWDRGRAAIRQQLRDPEMARQHQQTRSDDKRLWAQYGQLSERLEALHYRLTTITPELRRRHYGQGKWVRAGEFLSALNCN